MPTRFTLESGGGSSTIHELSVDLIHDPDGDVTIRVLVTQSDGTGANRRSRMGVPTRKQSGIRLDAGSMDHDDLRSTIPGPTAPGVPRTQRHHRALQLASRHPRMVSLGTLLMPERWQDIPNPWTTRHGRYGRTFALLGELIMGIQTTWDAVNPDTDGNTVSATSPLRLQRRIERFSGSARTRPTTGAAASTPSRMPTNRTTARPSRRTSSAVASGYLDSAELDHRRTDDQSSSANFRVSENGADTSSYAFATAQDAQNIEFPVFARDEDQSNSIVYSLSGEPMGWDAGGQQGSRQHHLHARRRDPESRTGNDKLGTTCGYETNHR